MTPDVHRPQLGQPDAPCRTCGAPLAADQRYCLQCGNRRAEARLPFLDILASQVPHASAAAAAQATTKTTSRGVFGRMSTNAAAVAGVACLVLALGVGVLIGGIGHDDTAGAAPQIITVGGAAPAAAVAPAATSVAPAPTATTPDAKTTTTPKAAKKDKPARASKTTNNDVKDLDKTSGTDYSKKSAKLPKQLGTGGKAPPKDTSGTKIGGGSDVEELG
ncbi:hypothetical protein DSM104299_01603 [Baekduia alba]|uniref:hypothetical protein n=1 Tax=Baekduia alba TaxID=2997333 RepID=UPI002340B15B|nr:hypothetical protein [Baekduia alba]WCB92903.1 hypothetical protein DSM104299_01603 [Baekduia alba]